MSKKEKHKKSDFFKIQDARIAIDQVCGYSITGQELRIAFKDVEDLTLVVTEEEIEFLDNLFL